MYECKRSDLTKRRGEVAALPREIALQSIGCLATLICNRQLIEVTGGRLFFGRIDFVSCASYMVLWFGGMTSVLQCQHLAEGPKVGKCETFLALRWTEVESVARQMHNKSASRTVT